MDIKNNKKRNSNHGVGGGAAISKPIKRSSLTEGVDMLKYGQGTNLREVERCLQLVVKMKFGVKLDFFTQMEYPRVEQPKINKERYKNADDPGYKIMLDKKFAKYAEQEFEFELNKPKLHAMIMGILSADGESVVRRHADFDKAANDPLALWKIVKSTHLVSSSNSDSEVIRQRTRAAYNNLTMGELEKQSDFKGRYD